MDELVKLLRHPITATPTSSMNAMSDAADAIKRFSVAMERIEAEVTALLRHWEGSPRGDAFSVALSIIQTHRATLEQNMGVQADVQSGG